MNTVYTIGHGTRTLDELVQILLDHDVRTLVDVRSYPGSRTNSQFAKSNLERNLGKPLRYIHVPDLGGRRRTDKGAEKHSALQVDEFRDYAAYMETPEFQTALQKLIELSEREADDGFYCCIMCAETLWWRCHRRMISDGLVARGLTVFHIGMGKKDLEHRLWDTARVMPNNLLIYDQNERDGNN